MPLVVVAAAFNLTGAHRQQRLCPVQGLNLRLLIYTQDQRSIGRIQVEPHDVAYFVNEQRIFGKLEGFTTGAAAGQMLARCD